MLNLQELFDTGRPSAATHNNRFLVLDMKGLRWAMPVDKIIGIQKVVVKKFPRLCLDRDYFEGAALAGDGSMALVLNCAAFAESLAEPDAVSAS